jgi:hypothetical protein
MLVRLIEYGRVIPSISLVWEAFSHSDGPRSLTIAHVDAVEFSPRLRLAASVEYDK